MEKSSGNRPRSFISTDQLSQSWKILCTVLEQKSNHQSHLHVKTLTPTVVTGLTRYAHWYNSDTCVTKVTNHFHIGSDAHFMSCNPYLILLMKPESYDQIDNRLQEESTVIILLSVHTIKMIPNNILLYSYIRASLNPQEKGFPCSRQQLTRRQYLSPGRWGQLIKNKRLLSVQD